MSTQGDALRRRLGAEIGKVKTALAVELAANLDEEMPVDTGWARANTIPSVGAPLADPVGSPEAVDAGAAAAGLGQVLANTDAAADLFVSNPVPYVAILDATHPTASGMIERAIDKATETVRARVGGRRVEL